MLFGEECYPMRKAMEALGRRRRLLGAAIVCLSLILTGCVSTKGGTPTPTRSVVATVVEMGKAARTAAGNSVVVHSYLSPVGPSVDAGAGTVYAAADVEACGGPNASSQTGVARSLFVIQMPDQTVWQSVAPVKKPELKPTYLTANHCERGWVTFRLPKGQKPVYVVLLSSDVVKWKIP